VTEFIATSYIAEFAESVGRLIWVLLHLGHDVEIVNLRRIPWNRK
jgi:hypothetical protein